MRVLTAAWIGAGSPTTTQGMAGEGACARCAETGALAPVRSAISRIFTAFDGWADPNGAGLCPACAWGHSTPVLRAAPHVITREPATLQELTRPEAGTVLRGGSLSPDMALVVPLRPGRKHILPAAVWGRVSTDDAHLPWREHDAELLQILLDLRGMGFGTRMLAEPAPPFRVLKALPPHQWMHVLHAWDQLAPWRAPDNPWLPLALAVTTPPSTTEAP